MLGAWGRKHNGDGESTNFVDAETEHPIDPVVVDRTTGAVIGLRPLKSVSPKSDPGTSPS